jgi:hypothetical protein
VLKSLTFKNQQYKQEAFSYLHIHEHNQKNELNTKKFMCNAFFMWTHYNKFVILENVSNSKKDKTLLA